MPSVAAGVIIEIPPGGIRGSMAVLVEFLLMLPEVTFALPDTDADWLLLDPLFGVLWLLLLPCV